MNWKDQLHQHLTEEQRDHDAYIQLADMAEEEGCCHEAGVLRDIAHEENTHHKLIAELME